MSKLETKITQAKGSGESCAQGIISSPACTKTTPKMGDIILLNDQLITLQDQVIKIGEHLLQMKKRLDQLERENHARNWP